MKRRREVKKAIPDMPMIVVMLGLMILGLLMIYSTSSYNSAATDQTGYLRKQLLAEGMGIVAIFFVCMVPYELLLSFRKPPLRYIPLVVAFLSMMLLLTPLAHSAKGATRWVQFGGLNVQPAEIVKLCIIIYLAAYISDVPEAVDTLKGFLKPAGVTVFFAGVIYVISKNLSSAIIIAGIGVLMLFAASKKWWQLIAYPGLVVTAALLVLHKVNSTTDISTLGYRYRRILVWQNPGAYLLDNGFQTLQALYAIGSGGLTGKGIGKSIQKLGTIPEVHNDMIYSVLCEELGLVGALVVVTLFGILLYRCLIIGLHSKDSFGMLVCLGVMVHIAIQVALNILVVTNTIPNTGVSLPFISYGGSSVVFLLVEMGLVLRISREADAA
ncbi:MAG: FtsW/RodA/SpoVE family cell cycle protein [Lachnospiraceae bacterium]|nr:FtsW/RodA/SpoVE family cell cycle protein [Lachnospiraceae bacterium]